MAIDYDEVSDATSSINHAKKDMAISSELSSDIVIALLEKTEGSPEKMDALKDILLEVHATLQSLNETARRKQMQMPRVRKAGATPI